LRDVVPGLVALVRSIPDASAPSVGSWTVGDVAAHLSHVFRADTGAIAGKPVPEATVTAAGMAELNAKLLAGDGERDPGSARGPYRHAGGRVRRHRGRFASSQR
jgi:hypothetical protein